MSKNLPSLIHNICITYDLSIFFAFLYEIIVNHKDKKLAFLVSSSFSFKVYLPVKVKNFKVLI